MNTDTSSDQPRRARLWLLVAITIILAGWALHATGAFMVPIVFSLFLALLVAPVDHGVAERVPKKVAWLGHVAAMGAILVALLVFVGVVWVAAQQVVERFPFSDGGGSLLPQFGSEVPDGPRGSATDAAAGTGATATGSDSASGGAASSSLGIFERFREVFSGAGGSLVGTLGDWASGIAAQMLGGAGATLGGRCWCSS